MKYNHDSLDSVDPNWNSLRSGGAQNIVRHLAGDLVTRDKYTLKKFQHDGQHVQTYITAIQRFRSIGKMACDDKQNLVWHLPSD